MEFGELVEGRLLERKNRFSACALVGGRRVLTHVANSGRLCELLTPGRAVWLKPMARSGRKTAFDLALVQADGGLVSVDARLPNALFAEALAPTWPACGPVQRIEREIRLGESRLDFLLTGASGRCWVEVKSVTLVHDGVAMFPDAPTARGARHLSALRRAVDEGDSAAVVFIVQREDADRFRPYAENDPVFALTLAEAQTAGVRVSAFRCHVSTSGIQVADEIPACLHYEAG